uniref:Uncharacterized protein n=1 Tax=viral metagenome TaxID=1070528 RepID=A0A6H1ZXR7_9ZZZZ
MPTQPKKIIKNKKIANHSDSPEEVYDKVRELIKLKDRKEFDAVIEEIETEDELEEYIFDEMADYIDEEICPDGFAFGIHEISQDIGIWEINEETEKLDKSYNGMVDRRDEEGDKPTKNKSANKSANQPSKKVIADVVDDEMEIPKTIKQSNEYKPSTRDEVIREVSKILHRQKMEIMKLIKGM